MKRIWIRRLTLIARIEGVPAMARFSASVGLPIQFALAACKGV